MLDAYISGLPKCRSFEEGITLSKVFPEIEKLTDVQGDAMMEAFNKNPDLRGSWGFNGAYPGRYGQGLAPHLSRATGRKYVMTPSGDMERKK